MDADSFSTVPATCMDISLSLTASSLLFNLTDLTQQMRLRTKTKTSIEKYPNRSPDNLQMINRER